MDEKTGGGGHPQAYDTETGRYGPSTDGGGENNTPPTPPDLGRELMDFLDEYEGEKSDDELLAEDDELEEKLPEVETKVNNDALATVYNRSLQNRSFEEITGMTRNYKSNYFNNCYMCALSCEVQLRGFDCMPHDSISDNAMSYYERKHNVQKDDYGNYTFTRTRINPDGSSTLIEEHKNKYIYGGFDIEERWSPITSSYEFKATRYPLFETVYKNYNPDRTIVYDGFNGGGLSEERAREVISNINEGERWMLFHMNHYTLLTRKNGTLYILDRYSARSREYEEWLLEKNLKRSFGTLTRVDDLEINTDTITMFAHRR